MDEYNYERLSINKYYLNEQTNDFLLIKNSRSNEIKLQSLLIKYTNHKQYINF